MKLIQVGDIVQFDVSPRFGGRIAIVEDVFQNGHGEWMAECVLLAPPQSRVITPGGIRLFDERAALPFVGVPGAAECSLLETKEVTTDE